MTRHALIIGGACVALLLAFAAGWAAHPDPDIRIDERGREAATVQTVEVYGSAQEWVTRRELDQRRDEVRVVYRERLPDGTERSLERTETSDHRHEQEADAGHREEQAAKVERVEVVREVERRVEVSTPAPDWRIAGLVGYDGGVVYGASVDRRILGPITVGAWGLSSGSVGASVGIVW